jgi:hypothetical protein
MVLSTGVEGYSEPETRLTRNHSELLSPILTIPFSQDIVIARASDKNLSGLGEPLKGRQHASHDTPSTAVGNGGSTTI